MLIRRERPGETQRVPRDRLASVRLMIVGAVILIALTRFPTHPSRAPGPAHGSSFDYYVLALSWSPGFCATHSRSLQCGGDDGFVLHGLWPQFQGRGYPANCRSEPLPDTVRRRYVGLYPSPSLIDHEWSKHGTCSGLDPEAYFQLTDRIRRKVIIPAAYVFPRPVAASQVDNVRNAFLQANPGMPKDGIRTTADRELGEVRICVTKAGDFRPCL